MDTQNSNAVSGTQRAGMKFIQRIIYLVAGLNLAWGTWDFVSRMFTDGSGWHYAIVGIVGIELVFLLLVMAAKSGTHSPKWSLAPLVLSAVIQGAKVNGDIAGKELATAVIMVTISVVSLLALACVVYLFELRDTDIPKVAQEPQPGPDVERLARGITQGAVDGLRAEFASMIDSRQVDAETQRLEMAQLREQIDGAVGWLQSLSSQVAQLAATKAQPQPAQLTQPRATATAQPAKIDKTKLVAGLADGATATELAKLFGVTDAAIRKTAEWRNREAQP